MDSHNQQSTSHQPMQHATFNTSWTLASPSRVFAQPLPKQRAWERRPRSVASNTWGNRGQRKVWKRYELRGAAAKDSAQEDMGKESSQDQVNAQLQTPDGKVVKRLRVEKEPPTTTPRQRRRGARVAVIERRSSVLPHKVPRSGVAGDQTADVGLSQITSGEREKIVELHLPSPTVNQAHATKVLGVTTGDSAVPDTSPEQEMDIQSRHLATFYGSGYHMSAARAVVRSNILRNKSRHRRQTDFAPGATRQDLVSKKRRASAASSFATGMSQLATKIPDRFSESMPNLENVTELEEDSVPPTPGVLGVDVPLDQEVSSALQQQAPQLGAQDGEEATRPMMKVISKGGRRRTEMMHLTIPRHNQKDRRASVALEDMRKDASISPSHTEPVSSHVVTSLMDRAVEEPARVMRVEPVRTTRSFEPENRRISRRQTGTNFVGTDVLPALSRDARRASSALYSLCEQWQPQHRAEEVSPASEASQEELESPNLASEQPDSVDNAEVDISDSNLNVGDLSPHSLALKQPFENAVEPSAQVIDSPKLVTDDKNPQGRAERPVLKVPKVVKHEQKEPHRRRTVAENGSVQIQRRTRRATAALEALRQETAKSAYTAQQANLPDMSPITPQILHGTKVDLQQPNVMADDVEDEDTVEIPTNVHLTVTINNNSNERPNEDLEVVASGSTTDDEAIHAQLAQETIANDEYPVADSGEWHDGPTATAAESATNEQISDSIDLEQDLPHEANAQLEHDVPISEGADSVQIGDEASTSSRSTESDDHQMSSVATSPRIIQPEAEDNFAQTRSREERHINEITACTESSATIGTEFDFENAPNHQEITEEGAGLSFASADMDEMMDLAPEPETTGDVTTVKIQLNDDDTDMLKDFLSRAKASKAAKIAKRSSLLSRQDSSIVKAALSSPRKALMSLDTNSPSPTEQDISTRPSGTELSDSVATLELEAGPNDGLGDEDELASVEAEAEPELSSRRSSRILKSSSKLPTGTALSSISIRRPGGEAEIVALKKSEAQQLALLTRSNTRRNKGGAVPARVMLLRLKGVSVDETTAEIEDSPRTMREDRDAASVGRVKWNEQLVAFYQEQGKGKENNHSLSLGDGNRTEVDDEKADKNMSQPRAKRSKTLGAANGTPAKPKYKGFDFSDMSASTTVSARTPALLPRSSTPAAARTKSKETRRVVEPSDTVTMVPAATASGVVSTESIVKAPMAQMLPLSQAQQTLTPTAKPARKIPAPAHPKKHISASTPGSKLPPKGSTAPLSIPSSATGTATKPPASAPARGTRRQFSGIDKENEEPRSAARADVKVAAAVEAPRRSALPTRGGGGGRR